MKLGSREIGIAVMILVLIFFPGCIWKNPTNIMRYIALLLVYILMVKERN